MNHRFLALFIFSFAFAGCSSGNWPGDDTGPYNWPKSDADQRVVEQRFDRASSTRLGTESDIAKIEKVILNDRDHVCTEVKEMRWLSAASVMVKAGSYGGSVGSFQYTFVLEKKGNAWRIVASYMDWVS